MGIIGGGGQGECAREESTSPRVPGRRSGARVCGSPRIFIEELLPPRVSTTRESGRVNKCMIARMNEILTGRGVPAGFLQHPVASEGLDPSIVPSVSSVSARARCFGRGGRRLVS
jgi:hypothetical protein